jgi:peroxiredoxin-like protein
MPELHSSYTLEIDWTDGKQGVVRSSDGPPALAIASPPQFGGPGGRWTPEHLFVGSAAACWLTTFLAVAELSKLEVPAVSIGAEGFLEKGDDRKLSIARILLRPRVTVRREEDREKALRLIQKAEDACLVARSMRTAVELAPEVTLAG